MVSESGNGDKTGKRTTAGLIIAIILALVICAGFIGYGLWESAEYERQANNQSSEYVKYTNDKIAQTCIEVTRLDAARCRYDAMDTQREHEYNQRDLVAQRQAALWAYIMGAAAVIGIALSAIGVWLVWTTFRETRLATGVAQENLGAVIDAERGILKFENHAQVGPAPNQKHWDSLTINTENIGRSALTVRRIEWYSSLNAEWPTQYPNAKELSDIVKPGANHQIEYIKQEPVGEGIYYVLGECEYETILGRKFKSYFCYWITRRSDPNYIGKSYRVVEMKHFSGHPRNT